MASFFEALRRFLDAGVDVYAEGGGGAALDLLVPAGSSGVSHAHTPARESGTPMRVALAPEMG